KTVFFCSLNIPLYHRDPAYHFSSPHRRITPFQTDPPYSIRHTTNKQWRTRHCYKHPHANTYIQIFRRTHPTQTRMRRYIPFPKRSTTTKDPLVTHNLPTVINENTHHYPHKIPHKGENLCQKRKMTYSRTSTNKTKNASITKSTNSVSKIRIMNFIQKPSTTYGTPTKNSNRPDAPRGPTS